MRATMRMSLSLCSQRPTTRGSWTEEKQGAVSIGGECDAYQDNAKDNFDAVAPLIDFCCLWKPARTIIFVSNNHIRDAASSIYL